MRNAARPAPRSMPQRTTSSTDRSMHVPLPRRSTTRRSGSRSGRRSPPAPASPPAASAGDGRAFSKTLLGLNKELDRARRSVAIQRIRHIEMQHVAKRGTAVAEAQAEANIAQQALRRRAERVTAEGRAHVVEDRAAYVEHLQRIPVGEQP